MPAFDMSHVVVAWLQDYLTLPTPSSIYTMSSIDSAFNNTWINARSFMMNAFNLTEDEAITAVTTVADFGVTQVVDGECDSPTAAYW